MRRLIAPALVGLPLVVIVLWLIVTQLPAFTQPQAAQFTGSSAACESVDLLRQLEGHLGGSTTLAAEQARALAIVAARSAYPPDPASSFLADSATVTAVTVRWEGAERAAWLAAVPLAAAPPDPAGLLPRPSAVLLLDGTSGDPFLVSLSPGTDDPAIACPFDLRGALVDVARSTPFFLLVAYIGGVVVGGGMALLVTRFRKPDPEDA